MREVKILFFEFDNFWAKWLYDIIYINTWNVTGQIMFLWLFWAKKFQICVFCWWKWFNDARIWVFSVQNQNFPIVQLESCGSPVHCQFGIIQVVPIMPVVLDHCLISPISSHFAKMKRTSSASINVIDLEHLRCEIDSCVCQFELDLSLSIVVMWLVCGLYLYVICQYSVCSLYHSRWRYMRIFVVFPVVSVRQQSLLLCNAFIIYYG